VVVSVPPASYRGPVRLSDASAAPSLSRRSVLLATAATAVAVTACTKDPADGSSSSAAPPAPDELLRRVVVAAEADLVALYASTAHAHPQLAVALGAIEDRHRRHFAAVAASGEVAAATRTGSTADPTSPSVGATVTALPVPADPAAALAALRSAEEAAAQARLEDCLRCEDPALAELFAAVAAGEAANGVLLPAAS
jgi:hypothetical protein